MLTFTNRTREEWLDSLRERLKNCNPSTSDILEEFNCSDEGIPDIKSRATYTIKLNGGFDKDSK